MVNKVISISGDVAAVVGILLSVLSGGARVFGIYDIAGIDAIAVFTVAIGIMVFACLAKLHLLTVRVQGA
jgi:hypothetical protein